MPSLVGSRREYSQAPMSVHRLPPPVDPASCADTELPVLLHELGSVSVRLQDAHVRLDKWCSMLLDERAQCHICRKKKICSGESSGCRSSVERSSVLCESSYSVLVGNEESTVVGRVSPMDTQDRNIVSLDTGLPTQRHSQRRSWASGIIETGPFSRDSRKSHYQRDTSREHGLGDSDATAVTTTRTSNRTSTKSVDFSDEEFWPHYMPAGWPRTLVINDIFQAASSDTLTERNGQRKSALSVGSMPMVFTMHSDMDSHESDRSVGCFILAPTSPVRMFFDCCSVVVLVYDLISIPWMLAWDIPVEGVWRILSQVVLCYWLWDVVINFRTGYYDKGEVQLDPGKIARNYVYRWFVLDVFLVCTDLLNVLLTNTRVSSTRMFRLSRLLRLSRLISFLRVARVTTALERIADYSTVSKGFMVGLTIGRTLLCVLYLHHVLACVWWVVGNVRDTDTGVSWIDVAVAEDFTKMTYKEADGAFQYFTSVHWSMTQMMPGSMQVNALNTLERQFSIVCLVVGMVYFGSLVSVITSNLTALRIMRNDKLTSLRTLNRFLRQRKASPRLSVSIWKQVSDRMRQKVPIMAKDVEVLPLLSLKLRMELHCELCWPRLKQHPFLLMVMHISRPTANSVCTTAMDFEIHSSGADIFMPGLSAHKAYLISHGKIRYTQSPEKSLVRCHFEKDILPGDWFSDMCLWVKWLHVGIAEAECDCELVVIKAQEFACAVMQHRQVRRVARAYALIYTEKISTAEPPLSVHPSDVDVPFAVHSDIVASLPEEHRQFISMLSFAVLKGSKRYWSLGRHDDNDKLEQEILELKCSLSFNTHGQAERVVPNPISVLRLARSDGRILVQLGKWHTETQSVSIKCGLPGTKNQPDETRDQAIQRLLKEELFPLAEKVTLGRIEQRDDWMESSKYGIRTKYTRAIHHGELHGEWPDEIPFMSVQKPTETTHSPKKEKENIARKTSISSMRTLTESFRAKGSEKSKEDDMEDQLYKENLYLLANGEKLYFYTWIDPPVFDWLRKQGIDNPLSKLFEGVKVEEVDRLDALQISAPSSRHLALEASVCRTESKGNEELASSKDSLDGSSLDGRQTL